MVAHKNIKILPKFKEVHPDCSKSESKYSDQYNKIVVESFGGSGNNDTEKEDKIIKNIAKGVGIEKQATFSLTNIDILSMKKLPKVALDFIVKKM